MSNALDSLRDGTKAGKREQTVLTPDLILGPLRSVWGEIVMDPCAPSDRESRVRAAYEICLPHDGLGIPWMDRTFVNPPYKELKPKKNRPGWLHHDQIQPGARVAWLVPVRTQRRWWRAWANEVCDRVIYLDPFCFVGYDNVFPAPMCIGYQGHDSERIVEAFRELGGLLSR